MSASREKKKRQEFLAANGGVDPKAVREAEQKAAEKKSKILYTSIAVIFAVVAIALLIFNSGIVQRSRAAVVIDGEKYNAADVNYYYTNAYQSFMQSGYGSYFIDTNAPLDSQTYVGDDTMTWADYFREEAVNTMKLIHAACKAAEAEGITLDDDDKAAIAANIESVKATAEAYDYSYESYLTAMFGSLMTPEIYEENLERSALATKYTSNYHDSLTFTDEEVQAYYEEHKNSYDIVDGGYMTISGKPETKRDADGNIIDATEAEKAAALEKAKNTAEEALATLGEGELTLEKIARLHNVSYTGGNNTSYTSGIAMDWLFDSARVEGDSEILFDEKNSTYYVVVFNSRQRDEAPDYDVRHILITEENLDLAEGEKAAEGAVLLKAQEILNSWDGTEDGFAALAKEHTQDGNGEVGGIYEGVSKGQMVSEFEDWCYAEGRKPGDTGIVETSYGQHIMYFVGYGDTEYWFTTCEAALASEAYNAWELKLIEGVTAEIKGGMSSAG